MEPLNTKIDYVNTSTGYKNTEYLEQTMKTPNHQTQDRRWTMGTSCIYFQKLNVIADPIQSNLK